MFFDGYSRHIALHENATVFNVWYRPATRSERDGFRHLIKSLGNMRATHAVCEWVGKHIVASDILVDKAGSATRAMYEFDDRYPELFETLWQAVQGVVADSSGERWVDVEKQWQQNLFDGVLLEKQNPQIAKRSCTDCKKFWFNETSGQIIKVNSTGENMLRVGPTLCESEEGCPKGTPEQSKALSKNNRWAYLHYLECKAVGSFPDDSVVRSNAVTIERAIARAARKVK